MIRVVKSSMNFKSKRVSSIFKSPKPLESELCIGFYRQIKTLQAFKILKDNVKVFHIANESMSSAAYGKKLIRMGMLPGIADYGINIKDEKGGRIAYLEFKRDKSCKQTATQKEFQRHCEEFGIPYRVVHTIEDGVAFVKELSEQY